MSSLAIRDFDQKVTEQHDFVYYKSPLRNLPNEILSEIFILGYSLAYAFNLEYRDKPPYPLVVSHVCSEWRHVALNTGELWNNVEMWRFGPNYDLVYKTWVSRAGGYPINATLDLTLFPVANDVRKILQDTIIPYRVKKLDITLSHRQLSELSDLDLDIEELAVAFTDLPGDRDFIAPPFFSRVRSVFFRKTYWEEFDIPTVALYMPWHELRALICVCGVPLSSWLNVLCEAPLLEKCDLIICGTGIDRLEAITLPNLRSFVIELRQVHPDTVIPFISAPKVTALEIESRDAWSADTYEIIRRQYKLNQLQRIKLCPTSQFPLRVVEVLEDAPVIHDLFLGGKPILDNETREKIASGQLGRFLTQLTLYGFNDNTKEWLDMVAARQKNVCTMLQTAANWQAMFTGLRRVRFSDVGSSEACGEIGAAALKLLGVEVKVSL